MKILRRILFFFFLLLVLVPFLFLKGKEISPKETISPLPKVSATSFRFAVLSDIHSDTESLQKAIDRVKADKSEFLVIAGDLTTSGELVELKKVKAVLEKNELPYFVLPGNHDLWASGINYFREVFGPDFRSFQNQKIKFILVNNADGQLGVEGVTGLNGENQGTWLRQELQECPKIYCLVFTHMPLNHAYLSHIMGEDSPEVASQAANLVREFKALKVRELFAGHIHYLGAYGYDGLKTQTVGAIYTEKKTQPARFLEVNVSLPEVNLEEKEMWVE
ncbi:MAG: metallophosphoesterase [Patescibacteria group bacterium]|nr:metallophosphoesterase [Patescibacteria group bacterium]MCL5095676.1 metallophosphoesterase [Patescibacteria group bacterium]